MAIELIFSEPQPFCAYANHIIDQMKMLSEIRLPDPVVWSVDWPTLDAFSHTNNSEKRNWKSISPFDRLADHRQSPAIYYFIVEDSDCKRIMTAFSQSKVHSLRLKRENGLKAAGFYNLCHVPDSMITSKCLYAGSVKNNLDSRLRQHLGYQRSGRTGALYLKQVFENLDPAPRITFHAYILPKEYRQLTEHIEFVFQEKLNPILGKRAFNGQLDTIFSPKSLSGISI